MLLASVIQGQVVSVYNTEKREACEQLDQAHQTPQSTSAPQTASLQETVPSQTALCWHCTPLHPGRSCCTVIYCSWLDVGIVVCSTVVCICFYLSYRHYGGINLFLQPHHGNPPHEVIGVPEKMLKVQKNNGITVEI